MTKMDKMVQVSAETHHRLTVLKGKLLQTGKADATYDDVIRELLDR